MRRLRCRGSPDRGEAGSAALAAARRSVGWAKRSVPTIVDIRMLDGGHAALCPPYEPTALSNLPHHTRLAWIAFQRVAIPLRCVRRGLIGALQEIEQRLVGIGRRAHGIVGQDEFAKRFAEQRRVGAHLRRAEARWLRIGIGIERGIIDRATAWPETGAADFV